MNTEVLREAPLFSGLDDEAAQALSAMMVESHLPRGEVLFREGDDGDRALRRDRGQGQARAHVRRRPREPAWRFSDLARCSASFPCSTQVLARRPSRR